MISGSLAVLASLVDSIIVRKTQAERAALNPVGWSVEVMLDDGSMVCHGRNHMSNEKKPGWLGCIGDEILPFVIGFIISHDRNLY